MTPGTPAPLSVAELIAQRRRGRYYADDGYLSSDEVTRAWPVVWDVDAVIQANGVRTKVARATGTYGTNYWTEYHAGDVQRVADAIAAGTAVLQPCWRKDTKEGREAQQQRYEHRQVRTRWIRSAIVLGLLLCVGVAWFLVARAY
ncbi:hypothetical protein AB8O64_37055 (plasmid) [Streptomyces sp. QH1-20]|uniref:hypothetical protein n=1 Tax=Streptomyces sp. QH1-20 TaxID=3240934 RepID=UPI003519A20F